MRHKSVIQILLDFDFRFRNKRSKANSVDTVALSIFISKLQTNKQMTLITQSNSTHVINFTDLFTHGTDLTMVHYRHDLYINAVAVSIG